MAATLFDGMKASAAGNAFYASSGADSSANNASLLHIRGHVVKANQIEFYYFSSLTGMLGPFHASRRGPTSVSNGHNY
jgi:hypothetical protein